MTSLTKIIATRFQNTKDFDEVDFKSAGTTTCSTRAELLK